jgi:hypothetical protein
MLSQCFDSLLVSRALCVIGSSGWLIQLELGYVCINLALTSSISGTKSSKQNPDIHETSKPFLGVAD